MVERHCFRIVLEIKCMIAGILDQNFVLCFIDENALRLRMHYGYYWWLCSLSSSDHAPKQLQIVRRILVVRRHKERHHALEKRLAGLVVGEERVAVHIVELALRGVRGAAHDAVLSERDREREMRPKCVQVWQMWQRMDGGMNRREKE